MKLLTALTLIGSAAAFAPAQTSSVSAAVDMTVVVLEFWFVVLREELCVGINASACCSL